MAQKPVKKQTKKRSQLNKKNNDSINSEIKSIAIMGIAFLMGVFIYTPVGAGAVGGAIKGLIIGLFGAGGYILPLALFFLGGYIFFTKTRLARRAIVLSILLFVLFIMATDIISGKVYISLLDAYSDASGFDGGAIGGGLANLLITLIGRIGSGILVVLGLIVSIIAISGKSLADFMLTVKEFMSSQFVDDEDLVEMREPRQSGRKIEENYSIEEEIKLKKSSDYAKRKEELSKKELAIKQREYDNKRVKTINLKSGKNKKAKSSGIVVFDYKNAKGKRKSGSSINNHNVGVVDYTKPLVLEPHRSGELKQNSTEEIKTNVTQQITYDEPKINTGYTETPLQRNNEDARYNEILEELTKQENLVENLKDELNRQRYLSVETQNDLIEQKKTEKSLLKIINAQRETIEKLTEKVEILKNTESIDNIETTEKVKALDIEKEDVSSIIEMPKELSKETKDIGGYEIYEESDFRDFEETTNKAIPNEVVVTEELDYEEDFEDLKNLDIEDLRKIADIRESETEEIEETIEIENVTYDRVIENIEEVEEEYTDSEVQDYSNNDADVGEEIIDSYLRKMGGKSVPIDELFLKYDNISKAADAVDSETSLGRSDFHNEEKERLIESELDKISQEDLDNLRKAEENSSIIQQREEILQEKAKPLPVPTKVEETPKEKYVYKYPTVDFLNEKPNKDSVYHSKTELLENSKKLETTLKSFGVTAKVIEVNKGPTVTRYEVQPGLGVKVSKIANLADDLALNLAAKGIRIQAPIPGKPAVGIEVPNDKLESVYLREVLEDDNFKKFPSKVAFGIGKDIGGNIVVADLAKMPHLLIAGATGSGKSVCINTMITSIIYKSSPEEVKLLMIDPKVVELSVYNGIPHLLIPVVTDPKKASAALNWAVREMEKRYKLFADNNVRDLKGFNQHLIETGQEGLEPQIVIIIDELADLMMTAAKEVEDAIMRLAAMARAAGIHLIIATQRPSVDVITGVIKSNIPSRLAFAVSSGVDSKTILDSVGAEKLLGKGDMLFSPAGSSEPMRIQGAFISDKEVESIVNFLKTDIDHDYMKEIIEDITSTSNAGKNIPNDKVDELLEEVVEFIIERQKASTSLIQRQFRVGFNRAARIVEELENFGVIGQEEGNKPRRVLMTKAEWDRKFKV